MRKVVLACIFGFMATFTKGGSKQIPAEMVDNFVKSILGESPLSHLQEIDQVLAIGDGIAGFDSETKGMALNLEADNVGIVELGADRNIYEDR